MEDYETEGYITRKIPESGINLVREYCDVTVYPGEGR